MIVHYDLFAGIGGFSLALEEVFYDKKIKHIFCEWESYPASILRKQWPAGEFWGDIADLVAHTDRERLQGEDIANETGGGRVSECLTIVTGGFPCQPFSHAGRRKGTADDRYQWPNMFKIIRNVKPDWVIAENVRGLVTWNDGMVLEQVCTDMESEDYEVQPFIIPAVATGASHKRDRIWIIAHAKNKRPITEMGLERKSDKEAAKYRSFNFPDWSQPWSEVALATCHVGVDDGLSVGLDNTTFSGAKARNEAIKAYGNSIVPQVAMQLFNSIRLTL